MFSFFLQKKKHNNNFINQTFNVINNIINKNQTKYSKFLQMLLFQFCFISFYIIYFILYYLLKIQSTLIYIYIFFQITPLNSLIMHNSGKIYF